MNLVLVAARGPYLPEVSAQVRVIDLGCTKVMFSLPKLIRHLRVARPDVLVSALETSNVVAVLAKRLSGSESRTVISQRTMAVSLRPDWKSAAASVYRLLAMILVRLTYRWADHVIAVSKGVAGDVKRFARVPDHKLTTIFNPLDLAVIEQLSMRADDACINSMPSGLYILGVGRLGKEKDFATLIRAFSKIASKTKASLVILGEGKERPALSQLVAGLDLQDRVALPGFVQNPFPWIARASAFVLSSLFEGCPNVLMQALACGTPVISTNCPGGSAEILEGGKWGRLVPVGDPTAMGEAILATLESKVHPDVRQRAGDFEIDRIARRYLQVLLPDRWSPAAGH